MIGGDGINDESNKTAPAPTAEKHCRTCRTNIEAKQRRARASPAGSAALWDDGPSSQERNSSSVRSRLRRRCGIVELNRQAGHFHRWTPLPVRPFFFIARPHTGHLFALLDGVLTPSSPPPGAHHFPRDKNDRPTRLLPQGRATVISTTKVPIGRRRHSHETRHRHRLERVPHQGRMAVERLDRRTYILAYNPEYGRSHQKQKGFRDKPRNPKGG